MGRRKKTFGGLKFGVFVIVLFSYMLQNTDAYVSKTFFVKDSTRNVSHLLDSLLNEENYDKSFRPGYGGRPTTITVNMNVRSMGPFSEKKESYSMQLYLRQVWYDPRLRFNHTDLGWKEFSMNWIFAGKIWKPDTFFINGKNSYFHKITTPNMFVRLRHDGQITWSMRLTVRAICKMHLRKYPLDTQVCPLMIASYGYSSKDMEYTWDWNIKDQVKVDNDVQLAQYILVGTNVSQENKAVRTDKHSTLTVTFELRRQTGFFLLQVYIPCILIVCCSWVAFWITKKDVPGRVCLGVTTVLSIATIGLGGRASGPSVSYATALDYFVCLCFAYVFSAVLEFALINFFERIANKYRKRMTDMQNDVIEKIARVAACGSTMQVITAVQEGKPTLKESMRHLLKLPLSAMPPADEEIVEELDEPKPGDTKDGIKTIMKLHMTALPEGAEAALKEEPAQTKSERSKVREKPEEKEPPKKSKIATKDPANERKKKEKTEKESTPKKKKKTAKVEKSNIPEIVVDMSDDDDDEEEEDESPPPPITVWQLLFYKRKLAATMNPSHIIPSEEELSDSFSVIDAYARKIFPTSFFLILTIYWFLYNNYITDVFPGEKERNFYR